MGGFLMRSLCGAVRGPLPGLALTLLVRRLIRPKGRSHIMVPGGGANAEGWTAFRDALARIEAYTSQAGPTQVSCCDIIVLIILLGR